MFLFVPDDSDAPTGESTHLPARLLKANAQAVRKKRMQANSMGARLARGRQTAAARKAAGIGEAGPSAAATSAYDPSAAGQSTAGQSAADPNTGDYIGAKPRSSTSASTQEWTKKDPGLVGSRIPSFAKPSLSSEDKEMLSNLSTAYDFYKLFQPDFFVNEIVHQSRLYAEQKGYKKQAEVLSRNSYRCMEAVLLHSGYHSVPRRNMIWELKPDCRNYMVVSAIRRDNFTAVLKCLHFRDNAMLNGDSYYKVRPIIDNLNRAAKWNLDSSSYSVDEVMVPYFGRHNTKQFIHGKPIRYGYKVKFLSCFETISIVEITKALSN